MIMSIFLHLVIQQSYNLAQGYIFLYIYLKTYFHIVLTPGLLDLLFFVIFANFIKNTAKTLLKVSTVCYFILLFFCNFRNHG